MNYTASCFPGRPMSLCRGSCNSNMKLTYKREALPSELQQHFQPYWYSTHNFTRAIMWMFDTPMITTSSDHYQLPVAEFPRPHAQHILLTFLTIRCLEPHSLPNYKAVMIMWVSKTMGAKDRTSCEQRSHSKLRKVEAATRPHGSKGTRTKHIHTQMAYACVYIHIHIHMCARKTTHAHVDMYVFI